MSATALDTLATFDRQAALDAGIDPTRVRAWQQLHVVYYQPTHSRQKQRLAFEKAQQHRLSLDQLALIERRLKPIRNARQRNKLRLELLACTGNYQALARLAKKLIPPKPQPPRKRVAFSRSRDGTRTMTVTADERDLADLEHSLREQPDTPMLETFLKLMRRDGAGVPTAAPRPLLLIPLPDWVDIQNNDGDDTILTLTDGTSITGADFLREHAATADNELEAATFHPSYGAVNLYRTQRLANHKQRTLARATSPTCTWVDCRTAADHCQLHHITSWIDGGATNITNLAVLCRYHNSVNDDDPSRPQRGRIIRFRGRPRWRSPRGAIVPAHTTMDRLFPIEKARVT